MPIPLVALIPVAAGALVRLVASRGVIAILGLTATTAYYANEVGDNIVKNKPALKDLKVIMILGILLVGLFKLTLGTKDVK